MKLYDGGATALIAIAVIYFGDWFITKINPPPKQCLYERAVDGGSERKWNDCGLTIEEAFKED